jgi:hypothetical protein
MKMSYRRFKALLGLATEQGLLLQTMQDFYKFAKTYSNTKTNELQGA